MAKRTFLVTNDGMGPTTDETYLEEYPTESKALIEAKRYVKNGNSESYVWRLYRVVSMSEPDVEYLS